MAVEGEILTDRWLLVPFGFLGLVCLFVCFLGSSASVDQVRPTDLKPFRVCLYCLTVSIFLVSLADHHGVTNMILPWKTVPCHLLACASWRWKPTMPLTSTETCMSVLPYRALCFLCFLQQACNTHNESKMWSLAASESGIPMYSRGRRVGSCWSAVEKCICCGFTIRKHDRICQLMLKADAEGLSCLLFPL